MTALYVCVLLCLFFVLTHGRMKTCGLRVQESVMGPTAREGFWPWAVGLRNKYSGHVCGGVLIGEQHVLLSAHCLFVAETNAKVPLSELFIAVGSHIISRTRTTEEHIDIADVMIHPDFNKNQKFDNDLAVLKLQTAVDDRNFWPACLPSKPIPSSKNKLCIVYGWGLDGSETSEILRHVDVPIVSKRQCQRHWKNMLSATNICVGSLLGSEDGAKGPCQGDSGSPLICKEWGTDWTVYGVTSWGPTICMSRPAIMEDVYKHLTWINVAMTKRNPIARTPLVQADQKCDKKLFDVRKEMYVRQGIPYARRMFVRDLGHCLKTCCSDSDCKSMVIVYGSEIRRKECRFYSKRECEMPIRSLRMNSSKTVKTVYIGKTKC